MDDLWIAIASFDDWPATHRCLEALKPATARFTVCVVDHGTSTATSDHLATEFPDVVAIRESPSLWWSGATNVGIRHAMERGAARIMLLNSDCVITPEDVERLRRTCEERDSVVAPVQRVMGSGAVRSVRAWTALWLGFPTLRSETRLPSTTPIETNMIIGGRGVVIPVRVFEHVGWFDQQALPHYLADHDFYLRCRRAGERLLIATDATVLVDESRSTEAAAYDALTWSQFRSTLHSPRSHRNIHALTAFFRRNYPIPGLWRLGLSLNLARHLLSWIIRRGAALLRRAINQ